MEEHGGSEALQNKKVKDGGVMRVRGTIIITKALDCYIGRVHILSKYSYFYFLYTKVKK